MKALSELGISPWPWRRESVDVMSNDDHTIVDADRFWNEDLANARLIAAAPELYEALRELYFFEELKGDGFRHGEDYCQMMAKAKAALAKASGEDAK